ncbi:hypothetical protein LOTGIDRAFT_154945 [Lottia gigantea]|uniref:DUF4706 domain-containing protein n=1 Tax=Lottia gigantea TaxID=225164 RepID=V3ZMC4_LOTGI|nr:hypothetical protein LOTGIDRAFT_154945 [Lottia gigantea]ESO85452.1 hypothetical protein LOTGIDRAFT_154945 [Lottia gigantea]
MEKCYDSYVFSANYTSRKLVKYVDGLTCSLGNQYKDLEFDQQEQLLNDFVVGHEIRALYNDPSIDEGDDLKDRIASFPRLTFQTGEKIIVDCENDFNTWRDEHSGPFSWKSLSQQNLTLDDLEPSKMTKPLSKQIPTDIPLSSKEFQFEPQPWTTEIITDYKSKLNQISTPTDGVNKGFEGSIENVSHASPASPASLASPASQASPAIVRPHQLKPEPVEKVSKPVPPKRHIKKSPVSPNDDKHAADRLLPKPTEEDCVFSNPTMAVNYSTFVGQNVDDEEEHFVCSVSMTTSTNKDAESHDKYSMEESHTDDDDTSKQETESGNDILSETVKSGFDFLDQW